MGIEPITLGLKVRCYRQLSYEAIVAFDFYAFELS